MVRSIKNARKVEFSVVSEYQWELNILRNIFCASEITIGFILCFESPLNHCSILFSPVHFPQQIIYSTQCLRLGCRLTASFVLRFFSIAVVQVGLQNFIQKLHPEWNCPR